jgi:hypothetical protein
MKRIIKLCLLVALLIPQTVFGEDIYFKAIKTTPVWDIESLNWSSAFDEVFEGSIVKGSHGIYTLGSESRFANIVLMTIVHNDYPVVTYANSLLPLESNDLFDERLLFNQKSPLIFSFYADALKAKDRDIIYLQDKSAWDNNSLILSFPGTSWWQFSSVIQDLVIIQTGIRITSSVTNDWSSQLLIKNIEKTRERYIVTAKDVETNTKRPLPWVNLEKEELFTVLLIPDGDFIDLYYRDKNTLVGTFVFTNNEFVEQLNNLISGEPVDLARIIWPRRADGSMDYSPPSPVPAVAQDTQPPANSDETAATDTAAETQSDTEKSSMPLWVWFTIGAVVIAGGVVAVLKQKK